MSAESTRRKPFRIYYGESGVCPDPLDPLEEDRRAAEDLAVWARNEDNRSAFLALKHYVGQIDQLQKQIADELTAQARIESAPGYFRPYQPDPPAFVEQTSRRDPMRLADECGRLADENRELKIENCELRRKLERLDRGRR